MTSFRGRPLLPCLLITGLVLLGSSFASAQTTLHVNGATGDDAVTRAANSAARPWRTIGRAAWGSTSRNSPNAGEAAQAGDTVIVSAGPYDFAGRIGNRWGVVYNTVNQGTAQSLITFRASGPVTLTAPSTASPVIGCAGRNYIVWEGPFELDEENISISPDTGSVVMTGATGCGLDGISVDGNGAPNYVDNHTGVRIEGCQSCYVRNSTIRDVRHKKGSRNGSGVMLYNSADTVVEHNYIYDVDNAVIIKGVFGGNDAQSATIIRYNLMVGCGECVVVSDSRDSRIYQNVIRDGRIGINLQAREPGALFHPVGDWIVNNTVDGMSATCLFLGGGPWHEKVRVWNNLLTNCARVVYRENSPFSSNDALLDWEHNVYHDFRRFAVAPPLGEWSFEQWQRTFSQDSAPPSSSTINPMFANAAAGDFRLCTGRGNPVANCRSASAALTVGVDLLDLDGDGSTTDTIPVGAYITNKEAIGKPSR